MNETLTITSDELSFQFVRSSGPGGQHVNRSATQVQLSWDVARSPSLTEDQRTLIMSRLRSFIDQDGVLHLSDQSTRSQFRNRAAVVGRLRELLASSQRVAPERMPLVVRHR